MIQMIKAPSILGLRPTGVEQLADTLLHDGLNAYVGPQTPLVEVSDLNHLYSTHRDDAGMINAWPLHDFSLRLKTAVTEVLAQGHFPVVLGGDCSILLGILPAMKAMGTYGLVTLDAHADFYSPSQSITGEAADMDVALVTGRGPEMLINIDGLGPYVEDAHVIHLGQRDEAETIQYGAAQIAQTAILCFGLDEIRSQGIETATEEILAAAESTGVEGFWLHLDTDVLHDEDNPAVDYRLPDGLRLGECEYLTGTLLQSGYISGLSIAIYNPKLDADGLVGKHITGMVRRALDRMKQ